MKKQKPSAAAAPSVEAGDAPAKSPPQRILSTSALGGVLMAVKTLLLDLNSEGADLVRPYPVLEFRMRPLSDEEWTEATGVYNKIAGTPPDMPTPKGEPQRYNDRDPKYLAKVEEGVNLQRVFALTKALPDFDFGTGTLEEKAAQFRRAVTPKVFDALYVAVRSLSTEVVRVANFI